MPQFAANLGFLFQEVDLLARYNAAAGAGFRGVETPFPYSVPPEALAARLQSCGLAQVLSNLPPGNWDAGERGFGALPGREEAFAESLEQALTYAQALSCTRLHAMAGISPAGASRASCEAVFIRNLRWAAETLRPHGIQLVIEPINTRDMPGYFLHTADHAHQIIENVGSDNLFLQMDLYHCQVMRGAWPSKFAPISRSSDIFRLPRIPGGTSQTWVRSTTCISSTSLTTWAIPAGLAANIIRAKVLSRA
jgi:2-dehydrotetronate isomerase